MIEHRVGSLWIRSDKAYIMLVLDVDVARACSRVLFYSMWNLGEIIGPYGYDWHTLERDYRPM